MANFAEAQLMKYGWTKGKGLGKNENGILQPIRASLKSDKEGIGHKNDEGNNWWEKAYNNAVQNINVEKHENEIAIVAKYDAKNHSTLNQMKKKMNPSMQYSDFLKKSTLQDGLVHHEIDSQEKNVETLHSLSILSDEELLKACHGRTAHKGARHGLTQKGKLQRIAEQDQQLVTAKSQSVVQPNKNSIDVSKESYITELDDNANSMLAEERFEKTKSQKKKEKRKIHCMTNQFNDKCKVYDSNSPPKNVEQNNETIRLSIHSESDEITNPLKETTNYKRKSKKAKKRSNKSINVLTEQLNGSCKIDGKSFNEIKMQLDEIVEETVPINTRDEDEVSAKRIKTTTKIEENDVDKTLHKTKSKINIIQDITISQPKSLNFGPLNSVDKLNYLIKKKKLKKLIRKQKKKRNLSLKDSCDISTIKEKANKLGKTDKKSKKKKNMSIEP